MAAVEPIFVNLLIYKLISRRPKNVVELGSGLTTLITAKTLDKLGIDYKIISIDSDSWFLDETKNVLKSENLYDERVEFVNAPIKSQKINKKNYKWYDMRNISINLNGIDLLIIDGPVGSLCENARYPAVPYFSRYLHSGSSVLLHDYYRKDEQNIVKQWLKENSKLEKVYRGDSIRGAAELIIR